MIRSSALTFSLTWFLAFTKLLAWLVIGVVRFVLITFLLGRKQTNYAKVTRTTTLKAMQETGMLVGYRHLIYIIALPFIGFVIPQHCFEIAKECLRERLAMWLPNYFIFYRILKWFHFRLLCQNETKLSPQDWILVFLKHWEGLVSCCSFYCLYYMYVQSNDCSKLMRVCCMLWFSLCS